MELHTLTLATCSHALLALYMYIEPRSTVIIAIKLGEGGNKVSAHIWLLLTFSLMRDTTSTWLATSAPSLAAVSAMARFILESLCCPVKGGVGEGVSGWREAVKDFRRRDREMRGRMERRRIETEGGGKER